MYSCNYPTVFNLSKSTSPIRILTSRETLTNLRDPRSPQEYPMARVNVMLPDELLSQIDHVARQEGVNRSKLLRLAVMAYFDQREDSQEREKRRIEIKQAMEIQDALRKEIGPWDPLKVLRTERQEI